MNPEQTEPFDASQHIAVDQSLGAFDTLPADIPQDKNVLAALLREIIDDGLKEALNDKQQQAAIVAMLCDDYGGPKLLWAYAVRLFAMVTVRVGKIGGEKASQYLSAFLIERGIGQEIYEGFRKFLATFDRQIAARRAFEAQAEKLNSDSAELMAALPAPLRAQAATLQTAEKILDELTDFRHEFSEFSNPPPEFHKFDQAVYDDRDRFIFETRKIPFIARPNDFTALNRFLERDVMFAWMVVHGGGGAGKSRLALEYCLTRAGGWDCGFLRREANQPKWERWRPQTPHLLVVDYPAADPDGVARLIKTLATRGDDLPMPVRVILLERENDGRWRSEIQKGTDGRVAQHSEADPLPLPAIDNLWPIFGFFFATNDHPVPDKSAVLQKLEEIDDKKRPLFAAYLADAMARTGNPGQWERQSLVDDVLQRDEDRYWWQDFDGDETEKKRHRALAGAITLCGGMTYQAARDLCAAFPDAFPCWDAVKTPDRLHRILGRRRDELPALEPDMLGERFVLYLLAQWRAPPDTVLAQAMLDAAARHNANKMGESLFRMQTDFSSDPAFEETGRLASVVAALNDLNVTGRRGLPVTVLKTLIENVKTHAGGNDVITRILAARSLFNLIDRLYPSDLAEVRLLYEGLSALVSLHPDEPDIRLQQAKAVTNLFYNFLHPSDLAWARLLYEDLSALASRHPDELEIPLRQAQAAVNLINSLGVSDLAWARLLYKDLSALVSLHPDEPDIRLEQAKGVVNLINSLGVPDLVWTRSLYEDLSALASSYSDEPEIRFRQAYAAFNLINSLDVDLAWARLLYEDLSGLALSHPDESEIKDTATRATVLIVSLIFQQEGAKAAQAFLMEVAAKNEALAAVTPVNLRGDPDKDGVPDADGSDKDPSNTSDTR